MNLIITIVFLCRSILDNGQVFYEYAQKVNDIPEYLFYGKYSFIGPDEKYYTVKYTNDKNGFRPQISGEGNIYLLLTKYFVYKLQ